MPNSVLTTTPKAPDPAAVSAALADLTANLQEAVRASAQAVSKTGSDPVPYDFAPIADAFSAFTTAALSQPQRLMEAQVKAWGEWTELWSRAARRAMGEQVQPVMEPVKGDRRFRDPAWSEEPVFDYLKQSYLLASKQLTDFVQSAEGDLDPAKKAQVEFFTRQYLNALSPTNFPMTNPEVLKKTLESGGVNLLQGLNHFFEDVARGEGLVSRRAPDQFELGVNIAATPGSVVYRNELMELIQYSPSTETVYKRPLLFVPPTVNKFYLFDLTPKSSYVKWLVDQGHTVFLISWVNPDEAHRDTGLADYVRNGPLAALDAIEQATGEKSVDLVAYCLGGTLSALALAYLAGTGQQKRVASATLIASLVDFKDLGEWSVFTDDKHLSAFEKYLDRKGYVEAHDLAKLFSIVRANDLIWSNFVQHYLLGEQAMPSDMLWWFADASRMPAKMLGEFGRKVLQENRVRQPGGLEIDGVPLDVSKVKIPMTFVSLKDDHVSGWKATYDGAKLFGGDVRFILGGSGHNAGTINPPAAGKHGFWTNPELPEAAEEWLAGAAKNEGSWWPEWQSWLDAHAHDRKVKARVPGEGKLPAIEPAPGSYVRVRH
ncbi:MAG TPA: class I poly(R)-hydroxyalkanoic acid synthase [Caulobacteraceae bacterium]|jgi:polyhydroxyalkanoate synthase